MPEINQEVTPQSEAVSNNWDALEKDYSETPLTQEKPAEKPVIEEPIIKEEEKKVEETKPEPTAEEKVKLEADALVAEKKELGLADTATKEEVATAKALKEATGNIEFKVEDIIPKGSELAAEGTWLRVAQDLKIEGVNEDTFDAFKAALEKPLVEQIEALKTNAKVDYLATLKPETATALKLIEMGIKEEQLFAPTREIDNYLAMTPEQLVRADLEERRKQGEAWTDDLIDAKMEELLADPKKLQLADFELRTILENSKKETIEQRTQLVQQFEKQKEAAALKQKEQETIQFEQTLNTVSKFMDVDIKPEIKQAIITKYRNGGYDNDFSSPKAKVDLILNKELGTQLIKSIRNTEFQKGLEKATKGLLNVPPVINSNAGSKVDPSKQLTNIDPWAAAEKGLGD